MSYLKYLYSEDNIQNTAESIYAITESLEGEVLELISRMEIGDNIKPYNEEHVMGLLMALKQLSKPLI